LRIVNAETPKRLLPPPVTSISYGSRAARHSPRYVPDRMSNPSDLIDVPHESLDPETLIAVLEEFVTRNGTDYGERERTVKEKVADVMQQLIRGDAKVVFDPQTSTVNIVLSARRRGVGE
jgi:uncharacterized protein